MRIPVLPGRKKARIEIIPLIDVVFFLLATFVMVSLSMVKNQGIGVNLPTAATGAPQERAVFATVTVIDNGDLYLDKRLVGMDELTRRLGEMRSADPELKVFINGDERAYLGSAVRVLDEVRKLGITKVSIQTKGADSARG
ncbi:MAG: ExbD/TolR family protein [Candidatus Omnitrophota bacterium]